MKERVCHWVGRTCPCGVIIYRSHLFIRMVEPLALRNNRHALCVYARGASGRFTLPGRIPTEPSTIPITLSFDFIKNNCNGCPLRCLTFKTVKGLNIHHPVGAPGYRGDEKRAPSGTPQQRPRLNSSLLLRIAEQVPIVFSWEQEIPSW